MIEAHAISASSLSAALTVAHNNPDQYRFNNSWLIDVDARIKCFSYEDHVLIAKQTTAEAGQREASKAQRARRLLAGKEIGGRLMEVIVPDVLTIPNAPDTTYLVSTYAGADLNQEYYQCDASSLDGEDWYKLVQRLCESGIQYRAFLPRNIVSTPEKLTLIDWEVAKFKSGYSSLDHTTWTPLAISWSYFFDDERIAKAKSCMITDTRPTAPLNTYEQSVVDFSGLPLNTQQAAKFVSQIAIKAESSRDKERASYKLDDAFHAIGDLMPVEIESLLDLLLASQPDIIHKRFSKNIAEAAMTLQRACTEGRAYEEIPRFQRSCALLAQALIKGELATSHVFDPISEQQELATDLKAHIASIYPQSKPYEPLIQRTTTLLLEHSA